jgi:hypothetical protein
MVPLPSPQQKRKKKKERKEKVINQATNTMNSKNKIL